MSFATISRAAEDPQLIARVTAAAQKEVLYNEELANTVFGRRLTAGLVDVEVLMWPVAVDTEAAYETAVNSGRGSPGHDVDVITDAALTSAVITHWPPDPEEPPEEPPV